MRSDIEASYQNLGRYSKVGNVYRISAQAEAVGGGSIPPLNIIEVYDPIPNATSLDGVLYDVGGVIVMDVFTGMAWTSPTVLSDTDPSNARTPHYSYKGMNSVWKGEGIGRSIPIIRITTEHIRTEVDRQKEKASHAAVTDITVTPKSIIEQVEWTLTTNPDTKRPGDAFEVGKLNMTGDYKSNIPIMRFSAPTGAFDTGVWSAYMAGIKSRVDGIRNDFNNIKRIFLDGAGLPTNRVSYSDVYATIEGDGTTSPSDGFGDPIQVVETAYVPVGIGAGLNTALIELTNQSIAQQSAKTAALSVQIQSTQEKLDVSLQTSTKQTEENLAKLAFDRAGNDLNIPLAAVPSNPAPKPAATATVGVSVTNLSTVVSTPANFLKNAQS